MGLDIEKERAAFEEWYGALNGLKRDNNGNYLYAETFVGWRIWQAAKRHAAKQDGWISVEQNLPSPDDTVLLRDYGNNMRSGYLDGDAEAFVYTDGDSWLDDGVITHWKRLPALPEKE